MTSNIIVHGGWVDETFFIWAERPPRSRFDQIVNFQYPFLYPPFELKLLLFRYDEQSFYGTFIDSDKAVIDVPIESRMYSSLAGEMTVYQAEQAMKHYSFPLEGLTFSSETLASYLPIFQSWENEEDFIIAPDLKMWLQLFTDIQEAIKQGFFMPTSTGVWHLTSFPYEEWLHQIPLSGRSLRANTTFIQHKRATALEVDQLKSIVHTLADAMIRSLLDDPTIVSFYSSWQQSVSPKWTPYLAKLKEKGALQSHESTTFFQEQVGVVQTKPFISGLALKEPASEKGNWNVSLCMVDRKHPNVMVEMEQLEHGQHPWRENPIAQLKLDLVKAHEKIELLQPLRLSSPTISLKAEDAFELFTTNDDLLKEIGFYLVVPKWLSEKKKPQVKLAIEEIDRQSASTIEPLLDWQSVASFTYDIAIGDQTISRQEFEKFVEGSRPFLYTNGEWIAWDPSLAKKLQSYLKGIEDKTSYLEAWRLDQLENDPNLDEIKWDISWGRELTDSLTELYSTTPSLYSVPINLVGELRPYQIEGMSWIIHLRRVGFGGCLADDMGLGKSIQTIAYMLYVIEQQKREGIKKPPFLLICPTSLLYNWVLECEQFAPSLRLFVHHGTTRFGEQENQEVHKWDIVITTYQLAVRDSEFFREFTWNGLILDEAQHIKNIETKQRRVIKSINATHKLALTGTPIENRLRELWSLLDVLNPTYLGTFRDFQSRFMKPIERDQDEGRLAKLQRLIHPLILRRKKSDKSLQLGLPEKKEIVHPVHLSVEQAALYQAVVDDIVSKLKDVTAFERRALILKSLTKLKQICNHPAHFLKKREVKEHESGKWDTFLSLTDDMFEKNEKVLIFSQYKEMGYLITQELEARYKQSVPFLHGSLTRSKRQEAIQSFQEDENIHFFVLSLKAGGVGLNLTSASNVIHYDRWWNPAVENQATDRAYRIGQTKDVMVHKLMTIGTLEERIDQMLQQKQELAEHILAAGEQRMTELSNDEILELIQLTVTN